MAGVFTDNQPDFAYSRRARPRSSRSSGTPFREIGPVDRGDADAAVGAAAARHGRRHVGVAVIRSLPRRRIEVTLDGVAVAADRSDLDPGARTRPSTTVPEGAGRLTVDGDPRAAERW